MSQKRTLLELQDAMASELGWRRKELHGLKSLVVANKATHNSPLFVRAAVPLLYAHWEGFVKQIGNDYLEFVARRQLKNSELPANFMAMAVSRRVREGGGAKMQACLDIVDFFRGQSEARSNIGWRGAIDTKSNLQSSVLKEIVLSLGLSYSAFETKEKLIDEKLLGNRNRIAHGQYLTVSLEEYLELHDEVVGLMQEFYNQIDNIAFSGNYRVTH